MSVLQTLAFLIPMMRHILDQPRLEDGEGPIGLIMAPARELAVQIYKVRDSGYPVFLQLRLLDFSRFFTC